MTSLRSAINPSASAPRHARSPPADGWDILRVGHGHAAPVDNDGAHAPWTTLRVAHVAHRRLDNPYGVAHMPTPPAVIGASASRNPEPSAPPAPPLSHPDSVPFDRNARSVSTVIGVPDDPK